MTKKTVYFVTGNANKLREFNEIIGELKNHKFENLSIDLPEYQGQSSAEIAREKCLTALRIANAPVFVEDTSLCFNALGSLPGPYIKWFYAKLGSEGLYKLLHGFEDKSAYTESVIAYGEPGQPIQIFSGRTNGLIVSPRGENNFPWNPIFQPDGFSQTYAEMPREVKNSISQRKKAIESFRLYLESL